MTRRGSSISLSVTDSRFMRVAAGGSFAVHLAAYVLAILLLAGRSLVEVTGPGAQASPPPPPPDPMTLLTPDMIIVEKKAPSEEEPDPGGRREAFVDASRMRAAERADSRARLEADRNTRAGSGPEADPHPGGSPDLPAQRGADIPFIQLVAAASPADEPVVGDGDPVVPEKEPPGAAPGTGADEAIRNALRGAAPRGEEVAVSAVETPRARYETAVVDALKASKARVVDKSALPVGSATVRFYVSREGRKEDPRFIGRPTDPRIGDAALSTVLDARLPAIPAELFEDLPDGRLPFTYEFISY